MAHQLDQSVFLPDPFCNRQGSLRLDFIRNHFEEDYKNKRFSVDLTQEEIVEITDLYVAWRDTVELIPFRKKYEDQKIIYAPDLNTTAEKYQRFLDQSGVRSISYLDFVFVKGYRYEWEIKECCKRGNHVYTKQLIHKFRPFLKKENQVDFFTTVINKKRKRIRKTRLLYITGTCNHEITGSISASWITFGAWWNRTATNLREQFGKVDYIRAWQSQKNGYPHFHALVYFHDYEFTAVYWPQDKTWRVHNRQMLRGVPVRDRIKSAWKAGNLDIKCCDNSRSAFIDLLKYVTRDLMGGESDLTNAMVWYYGKQSFAVSKGFAQIFGANASLEPSDADWINAEGVIQSNNSKSKLVSIEIFPVIRADLLPNFTQTSLHNYEDPPEPPPETVDFLEYYTLDCKPSKVKINSDGLEIITYKRGDLS